MENRLATIKGKVVGFMRNKIIAVLQTEFGIAYVDWNSGYDYELQIGDEIYAEDTNWYVTNGRIVTMLDEKFQLNGTKMDFSH
jgi:hypothetical protein